MKSRYPVARFVNGLTEVLAWLILAAGGGAAFVALRANDPMIGLAIAGGAGIVGVILIAIAQMVRTQIDTADNTAALVEMMRAQTGREAPAAGRRAPVLTGAPPPSK